MLPREKTKINKSLKKNNNMFKDNKEKDNLKSLVKTTINLKTKAPTPTTEKKTIEIITMKSKIEDIIIKTRDITIKTEDIIKIEDITRIEDIIKTEITTMKSKIEDITRIEDIIKTVEIRVKIDNNNSNNMIMSKKTIIIREEAIKNMWLNML